MLAFFNGRRRKAGCATLVLALAITGSFVRSQYVWDEYVFGSRPGMKVHSVACRNGGIWYILYQRQETFDFRSGWNPYQYSVSGDDPFERTVLHRPCEWRRQTCGFDFGKIRSVSSDGDLLQFRSIPHWPLILALTLLSAYLLLVKRQPPNPQNHTDSSIHPEFGPKNFCNTMLQHSNPHLN